MTSHRTTDDELALAFLAGMMEEKGGTVSHKYFEKDSEGERQAQAALVRLLRGDASLSHIIRFRLAALLDPTATDERQFKIVNRRRGPSKTTPALALEIARFIAAEYAVSGKMEAATEAAKVRFSVSLRTAQRAWADNKDSAIVQNLMHPGATVN